VLAFARTRRSNRQQALQILYYSFLRADGIEYLIRLHSRVRQLLPKQSSLEHLLQIKNASTAL
jgi:hypothetical protein